MLVIRLAIRSIDDVEVAKKGRDLRTKVMQRIKSRITTVTPRSSSLRRYNRSRELTDNSHGVQTLQYHYCRRKQYIRCQLLKTKFSE